MPKTMVIRKANDLIEARYKLSLAQQRIILYLNAQIKPWDKDFQDYNISVMDFCNYLEIDPCNAYQEFLNISDSLVGKTLKIRKGENTIVTAWLSSAIYHNDEGMITLKFSPELREFLLELGGRFTSYSYNDVKHLRSTYSYRIYELLKQYKNYKERTFDLDELKDIFQINNCYSRYSDFKKDVILIAQRELLQKADIYFEFEEIKRNRKIVRIRFLIYPNPKNRPPDTQPIQITLSDQDVQSNQAQTSDKAEMAETGDSEIIPEYPFIAEPLTEQQRKAIHKAANGNIDKIRQRYEIVKSKPNVHDLVGYMITILQLPDNELSLSVPINIQGKQQVGKKNRFVNFEQREIDFAELERMELELLKQKIPDE